MAVVLEVAVVAGTLKTWLGKVEFHAKVPQVMTTLKVLVSKEKPFELAMFILILMDLVAVITVVRAPVEESTEIQDPTASPDILTIVKVIGHPTD